MKYYSRILVCVLIFLLFCALSPRGNAALCADRLYDSLQDAVDHYTAGERLVLLADAENITVCADTVLDLNGYSIHGITVTDGTLYLKDSQTDDFTVADGHYGTVTNVTGHIAAADGYLQLTDEKGFSFHRVSVHVSGISLRPSAAGLYYTGTFEADEMVAAKTECYGVALSVQAIPDAENLDSMCEYSVQQNFISGQSATGTLLKRVIKTASIVQTNQKNAAKPIYGSAYLKTSDGYFFGPSVTHTLRSLTESIDGIWTALTSAQQAQLLTMYETFESTMSSWTLPNLRSVLDVDEPAGPTTPPTENAGFTMTKEVYNSLNYWLYTPANATANMPLIVYLHGGSGKGEDLELITGVDGFPQYIQNGKITCDAYIIFPQCPSTQKGWKTMGNLVESLILHTCDTYQLDKSKVSLTGHSMGGTGAWTLALDKPDLFYKVAPMSGSVTLNDNNLSKLAAIPVWAFVGSEDKIVSPDTSIAMIEALQQKNANAKLTVFEGADHFTVPSLGYLETDVVSWLIS